jgi:tape measure domain-containing protein
MATELSIRISTNGSEKAAADLGRIAAASERIGPALAKASGEGNAGLNRIDASAARAAAGVEQLSGKMAMMGHLGAALTIAPLFMSQIVGVGRSLLEASASAERLRTQLSFSTGDAGKEFAYLTDLSNRLGLEFKSTAQAYGGFAAAARGTALEGQKARDVFEAVAKAGAVMGLSADQSSGALLAIQQMMAKGVVSAEEFRGQMGERMPIALQAGARALGVTTEEFSRLLESGKIVAEDFLPKFAQAITEMLGDAPEKAAERLDAAVNRMANSWGRLKQAAGDSGISRALANDMNALTATADAMAESMTQSAQRGAGGLEHLANAAGVLIGRGALGAVASVAETVNGALNLLSGGALHLSTNLSLLPDNLRPVGEQLASVEGKLKSAQAEYDDLARRVEKAPNNIYIRGQLGDLAEYIARLRQARGELALLTATPLPENYGNEGRGAVQQKAADEAALAASRKRAKAYGETIEKYATPSEKMAKALREARENLGEFFTPDVESRIVGSFGKAAGGGRKGAGGGGKLADAGAQMLERLDKDLALKRLDAEGTDKQTAAEKQRQQVLYEMDHGLLKVTASQRALIAGRLDDLVAVEKQTAAQREFAAGVERQEEANRRERQALHDKIAATREAADLYGLTETQIAAVTVARLEEARAMAEVGGAYPEQLAYLDDEIALRRELAGALDEVELKRLTAGTKSAEAKKREADVARLDRGKAEGKVTPEEYDEALAKIKGDVGELDEFGKKAAQNMQSAFADFLFDPFAKGTKTMAQQFGEAVRRMISEAGSAQLLKLLLGDFAKTGDLGGWIGSLAKGFSGSGGGGSSWIGSLFSGGGSSAGAIDWSSYVVPSWHAGGMVEPGGQTFNRLAPAALFAGAGRYHSGGWPGLRNDEVPAILQRGERVLTREQQRSRQGGDGGRPIVINVNSSTGDPAEIRRSAASGARTALGFMGGAGRYR